MIPGSNYIEPDKCSFTVWAPNSKNVKVVIEDSGKEIELDKKDFGYWHKKIESLSPGTKYFYLLDDKTKRPDPASKFQPDGVHGPSQVIDHNFRWQDDNWQGINLKDMIIYELHVGTFSEEGNFDGVLEHLAKLKDIGINAIELMPVAQFPGSRNWGYDGAYPYAVQNSYGGPEALKRLVNGCHENDVSVILDVVYNHLGPEGNYLRDFGPYFTDKYHTPWGEAVNLDGPNSDHVREYFIENALYWLDEFHIDALRLDALHAIYDMKAKNFVEELSERVESFSRNAGRKFYLIGESDLNNTRYILPRPENGYGLDSQWCDDFHHSVHALVTGEENGYYKDFGKLEDFEKSFTQGYVYSGQYSSFRKHRHGNSSKKLPAERFMVFTQNHDQIGNRMQGERISSLVDLEAYKLCEAAMILSPYVPMLFMGQEYAEENPFQYFVSHNDQQLVEAVRNGRADEFKAFNWKGKIPDPQSEVTFKNSKLKWQTRNENTHKAILDFHRELISFRKEFENFTSKENIITKIVSENILLIDRLIDKRELLYVLNFSNERQQFLLEDDYAGWIKVIDSADKKWAGPGMKLPATIEKSQQLEAIAWNFALFEKIKICKDQQL